ncbi:hypothetical protein JAAARDRAFT_416633 [Jaapia argillacea MUCL 33604]|uniref:O-methylsterigmatocystin oxidoreductase n=1 Tax=Jaapia argillacea MUCL 33604 TaxID=933084 RepID=A0A067PGA2_9AGAM|nr:hypothetical protein JAAARDRAFT_416633 [Jaapia argillacea MUCL 33604]
MGWSWNFSFLPYGPKWRNHRRVFHQYFNQHAIEPYKPIQLRESRAFLRRLLDKPEEFGDHICLAFTATIMDVTYGIKVADKEDKYVTIAEAAIESASRAGVPGAYLVDFFPILKHVPTWFPGAGFKRKAEAWRRLSDEFINGPFEAVKTTLREHGSDTQPSIASALLRNLPERDSEEAEELARNVTALAYAGGADTSANVIRVFFLAMVSYPEAQKKAQAELDSVIGNSRLPDFSDQKDLPYVNALIKETLRWQPVTPLAIPHSATADDVYEGYFIPKGSIILGNSWSMLRDPIAYPEPEEFKPERFLKDGELNPAVRDPDTAAFGYGRRICPGRHFSSSLLYALISSTLAVYEIGPPLDERGEPVLVTPEMTSGLLS